MLRERLRAQEGGDLKAHIFPENWNRRAVSQQFNRVLKRAKMHERDERDQKLRVHSFRHYYATHLASSGIESVLRKSDPVPWGMIPNTVSRETGPSRSKNPFTTS